MADVEKLKTHVCALANEPRFIHHQWFVDHHLKIIEQIVEELLVLYPAADKTVCRSMVWIHDWGKIVTNKGPDEEEVTERDINERLPTWGYSPAEVGHILSVYHEMETLTPQGDEFLLETKIISSADGLAHYIGPFFAAYWHENPNKSVETLIADNIRKIAKDEKKLMLPEARAAALAKMQTIREYDARHRPARYLNV